MKPEKKFICQYCYEPFEKHGNKNITGNKFCCEKHRNLFYNNEKKQLNLSRKLGLRNGETGQINEYLVAIDLIKKGYKVFFPFDTTAKADLLIFANGEYLKVQVKTGSYRKIGVKAPVILKNNAHDILAVVYNLSSIEYLPDIISIR